jgi:hypothetical protein
MGIPKGVCHFCNFCIFKVIVKANEKYNLSEVYLNIPHEAIVSNFTTLR